MKLLILTLDTRGDVQPFVALPRGLANAGHEAVLAAPHRFEGFVRDQAYRSPGSTTAGPSPPKGRAPARTSWCTTVRWSSASMSRRSWGSRPCWRCRYLCTCRLASFPGRAERYRAGGPLGAESGHLSRGEGPGDDVRPHRRQVARRWTCRDAVAGMIRAAAPTAHRRRCCTRSADMCCHGRRLAGCSHGDRLLLVPGRHRARAITSPCALKAA